MSRAERIVRGLKAAADVAADVGEGAFDRLQEALHQLGVKHAVSERGDTVTVHKIVVPENQRNQGVGSQAMRAITSYADQKGKKVALSPSTDFGATSKKRLVGFYKKHGFTENKGKSRDFSVQETMVREPVEQKPASTSLRVKTEDEGDWELPDLSADVPITFNTQEVKVPARVNPSRGPIEAYHGTPHRFEPEVKVRNLDDGFEFYRPRPSDLRVSPGLEIVEDYPLGRFNLDKMGSGTGTQMYGRGIYTAEAPNVARPYRRDNLPAGMNMPTLGGVDANLAYARLRDQADRASIAESRPLYDRLSVLEDIIHTGDPMDVEKAMAAGEYAPDTTDWYKREVEGKWDAPGALYKLNLHVDPENMLAWNTPLKEQPQVLKALGPLMQRYGVGDEDLLHGKYPMTGGDVYHRLSFRSDIQPKAMADMLTGSGLSGIRYVDTGSGPGGSSTQNYVMMNPDLIEILKRYRAGGAVQEGEC